MAGKSMLDLPAKLVAFDLDGTLLRGDTACLAIATRLGQRERMLEMERLTERDDILAAREEMTGWYQSVSMADLCASLEELVLAPGTLKAFQLLKQCQIRIAIISVTWDFAVAWVAQRLGADSYVGSRYYANGLIGHFWPEDKPRWLRALAESFGLQMDQVAAVGDSPGDFPMLRVVGHPFFVGKSRPSGIDHLTHYPDGNILSIARQLVDGDQ